MGNEMQRYFLEEITRATEQLTEENMRTVYIFTRRMVQNQQNRAILQNHKKTAPGGNLQAENQMVDHPLSSLVYHQPARNTRGEC